MQIDAQGQWFGNFTVYDGGVETTSPAILNLDSRPDGFGGLGYVLDGRPAMPMAAYFTTLLVDNEPCDLRGHADIYGLIDPISLNVVPRSSMSEEEFQKKFPGVIEAKRIGLSARLDQETLHVTYATDAGTYGTAILTRRRPPEVSTVTPEKMTWSAFRKRVPSISNVGSVYRGQGRPWSLQSAFHRKGRVDTVRFGLEDVGAIESAITSVTNWVPPRNDDRAFSAVLGIAQHHGYPTPLLDWTKSPYVAAYFACDDALRQGDEGRIIVFEFDAKAWAEKNPPVTNIGSARPGFSLLVPSPVFNPRLVPQQSVLMYCNVHDVERFIRESGESQKRRYMAAFEIAESPRLVLRDLRTMGVYAGSLFPGLDGACRGAYEDSIEDGLIGALPNGARQLD